MRFAPLSQAFSANSLRSLRLIATDIDGTLTIDGKFTPALLQSFEQLTAAGMTVIVVTGRSAGWVSGLAHYLPVWGAIAENGGMFYPGGNQGATTLLQPIADLATHRQQLAKMFYQLQSKFPKLQESTDNCFRLTDWTFDVQGLTSAEIQQMRALCDVEGWGFTYSTVQCHLKLRSQDKATGLRQVLDQYFPAYTSAQILTVGDSPNDESMFDTSQFPLSVGVANVRHYADQLSHQPAYITDAAEGKGFCELAESLLNL